MQVTVNGIASHFNVPEGTGTFDELVRAIRVRYESANQLLTSFRVNGVELNPADEATLSALKAEDIETVDLVISNPRELAEDTLRTLAAWRPDFEKRLEEAKSKPKPDHSGEMPPPEMRDPNAPKVGLVTEESLRRFAAKRKAEARLAERVGIGQERVGEQLPTEKE